MSEEVSNEPNFLGVFADFVEEVWDCYSPKYKGTSFEEELLIKKLMDWLSEDDMMIGFEKMEQIMYEYKVPQSFIESNEITISFLKSNLKGLGQYFPTTDDDDFYD